MKNVSQLKVAIVHDWLTGGGAERVVLELHHMFPEAPIYTSYATDEWRSRLDGKVVTGYLQHWPFRRLRKYLPVLRIWWFSRLKFDGYDLVISSSGAEAKGIRTSGSTVHVNYCHAPTHYYWLRYDDYLKNPGFGLFNPLARLGLRLLIGPLRHWDYKAAQRPNFMIANSSFTASNIKKYYGREATVIHPPVDVERFSGAGKEVRAGFVTAGQQTPYKQIDRAVLACSKLNVPLTVIGDGPEHRKLMAMAGPSVTFLTDVLDADLPKYFGQAAAFIFPGVDDFGIVAVEALAAGTPVIAFAGGGALDYVVPGKTGAFFTTDLQTVLKDWSASGYYSATIRSSAQQFSASAFKTAITSYLHETGKIS